MTIMTFSAPPPPCLLLTTAILALPSSPSPPCSPPPLDIFNYEIPSINVNLDSLIDEFATAPRRISRAVADSPEREWDAVPEEDPDPQSTAL